MINLRHDERSTSETDASFFSQPDVAAHLYPILPDPDRCSPNRTNAKQKPVRSWGFPQLEQHCTGQTPRSPIAVPHTPSFYARLQ